MPHIAFAVYRQRSGEATRWWLVLEEWVAGEETPVRMAWAFDRPLVDPERVISQFMSWSDSRLAAELGIDTNRVGQINSEWLIMDRGSATLLEQRGQSRRLGFDGQHLRGEFVLVQRGDGTAELGWAVELPPLPEEPVPGDTLAAAGLDSVMPILKSDSFPERYVLGIVMEPDVEDSGGHIASAEVIRKAAHYFLENGGRLGENHVRLLPDGVKLLESSLAPVGFSVETPSGPRFVKQGTWLLATRVNDDVMWSKILSGELTGYSYSGLGRLEAPQPAA